jgi:endogenous inhibitor of DNA gyrase (YacG/DUF329 family)
MSTAPARGLPQLTPAARRRYDASVTAAARVPAWAGNPHRPFCSLTCRLIDLGVWLDERYRVAGDAMADESEADDRVPSGTG